MGFVGGMIKHLPQKETNGNGVRRPQGRTTLLKTVLFPGGGHYDSCFLSETGLLRFQSSGYLTSRINMVHL